MKKLRILTFLLAAALLAALAPAAYADVIWEPDNSFYWEHSDQCSYTDRYYTANAETDVRADPLSSEVVATLPAGTKVYVSYIYTPNNFGHVSLSLQDDGTYADDPYGQNTIQGWVNMGGMTVVYDGISFAQDHEGEFYEYGGDYSALASAENLLCWNYPGGASGYAYETYPEGMEFSKAYTDENGLEWGYVSYFEGNRDFWICIDDPSNPDLAQQTPASLLDEDAAVSPADTSERLAGFPYVPVAIGLVLLLVVATAFALHTSYGKKNRE